MASQLFSWVAVLPIVAAMVTTWVGVTYPWLRLLGLPRSLSVGVSPAVTTTVITVLSVAYFRFGWFWSGVRVLPLLAFISGVGFYLLWREEGQRGRRGKRGPVFSSSQLFAGVAAASGFVLAALPSVLAAPATNPVQQWDPTFHMNGVWGMTQLGVGAPGEGLAHNYGGAAPSNYPIGWHTFTALFATGPTTVQVANASSLALMAVWVVGVGVFTYTLYPRVLAKNASMVIAGTTLGMPSDALGAYSQWPNAMSVAFLPGVAALAVYIGRDFLRARYPGPSSAEPPLSASLSPGLLPPTLPANSKEPAPTPWTQQALWFAVLVAGVLGGITSHQVFAFNLAVLLLPGLIAGMITVVRGELSKRNYWVAAAVVLLVVPGFALARYILLRPEVRSMASYPRSGVSVRLGVTQALLPTPPAPTTLGLAIYPLVLTGLVALGIIWVFTKKREGREVLLWPVGSALLFAVLVFFAYAPDWAIRTWIVGPWFNDGRRIMEPQSLILATFAGLGAAWLIHGVDWLGRTMAKRLPAHVTSDVPKPRHAATRFKRADRSLVTASVAVGVALLGGTMLGALDARVGATKGVLDADNLGKPGMANQEVVDLMATLPGLVDEDAVILGDPQAGAAYAQALGQRWAYFPQLSYLNADKEAQQTILHRFKYLNEEQAVCDVIKDAGITHYFAAPDGKYYGRARSDRSPGLYDVDVSTGFELVAEAGGSALYKITACD